MKILCVPYSHTLSHVSRPLVVAKELKSRGHEVVFAGTGAGTKFITGEGFNVYPLYEPDPEELFGNIRKGRLRFVKDDEIERMLEADIDLFKKVRPDIVLTDGRFSALVSTQILGARHAAIVNVSSTEYRALPYIPFFEWMPDWTITRNTPFWKNLNRFNLKIEMLVFDNVMNIFKSLSKKYGLKKTVTATNCLTGRDITLLPDIPEYFPSRNLPENYHYVGPLTWQSNTPPPRWWPPERGDGPLIYITMGTTGVSDFFDMVYELIGRSEIKAIITTGTQARDLKPIKGRIYIEEFMDGGLAMEACDMVVCHGGNGTIYQALEHGKPVIGIPTIPDQKFNMRRVEALGVGKTLTWKEFSADPGTLLKLIRKVLDDKSFRQRALDIMHALGTYHPAGTAADIIERELAGTKA